jgi:hypothetical protein
MLVVVATARDSAARTLAESGEARLLTPRDLSRAGWHCRFGSPELGNAVVGGEIVSAGSISGVITRLPWITAAELDHVVDHDRGYVAAEMQAFLFAWLSRLPCPVLNRPTPYCLSGPAWRNEHWIHAAARAGIPVRAARRSAVPGVPFQPAPATNAVSSVTVVAGQCTGARDALLEEHTRAIAASAGCAMLTAHYEETAVGFQLVDVSLWPDLADPLVRALVLGHFAPLRAA